MRFTILKLTFAAIAATTVAAAHAQYPDKPVRIVVPFPAGGALDTVTRIVADKLSARFNQQFVVEPKPGAGGTIGSTAVARAAPDGYTLVMGTVGTHGINSSLYANLPYDPVKDFVAVAPVASAPNVLVVNPTLGVKTIADLVALARKKQGEITYGSGGNGTTQHLAGALFATMAGAPMTHVAYKGVPPAMMDLVAGRTAMMFSNIPVALPFIRQGQLNVLATASAKRSPSLPQVPTVAEAGLPGYEVETWYGLFAPAGTPPAIVTQLNGEIARILGMPEVKKSLMAQGTEPLFASPQEFAAMVDRDLRKWGGVIKAADIKAQ